MSAIEWLPFISPFIWLLLIANVLAYFPVESGKQGKKPFRVKFTLTLLALTLIGWLFAHLAVFGYHQPSLMSPYTRRTLVALSEYLLPPTLILFAGVLLVRLIQGKSLLNKLLLITFTVLSKVLAPLGGFLAAIAPHLPDFFAEWSKNFEKVSREQEEEDQEELNKPRMNLRGEYSSGNMNKY